MELTYLDSNSWLIEMAGKRILLDPWLVGSLIFGNAPWLFKGDRPEDREIPADIDLILLSQGLEDHAHPETLKILDKTLPVVCSPNGQAIAEKYGYQTIHSLPHGGVFTCDNLEIRAVKGSPVGPTTLENGYILTDLETNKTLYYEPHGYHSEELKQFAPIDVVVTPLINLKLPLLGAVIKGQETALKVCDWLKPKAILPTAAGGDVHFDGFLMNFLKPDGTVQDFAEMLAAKQVGTKVIEPEPGKAIALLNEP
ncbi:MBL fold metallo-hydrolase [[Limnothrix rosea] IAM M-220]|uniref:MBL fold metallo-hydrolase n=1 Tax=[Limnothrix rosea] IAM M-220 TaxID=454133 RepID=UPI00095D8ECF|nr:MBL fold metallo-hydrolase [[Limnothrix rosea] IAM M-220]OKH14193.1 Zn-dependent hydrolase [[Limnothrix rosea] IAM M-220]